MRGPSAMLSSSAKNHRPNLPSSPSTSNAHSFLNRVNSNSSSYPPRSPSRGSQKDSTAASNQRPRDNHLSVNTSASMTDSHGSSNGATSSAAIGSGVGNTGSNSPRPPPSPSAWSKPLRSRSNESIGKGQNGRKRTPEGLPSVGQIKEEEGRGQINISQAEGGNSVETRADGSIGKGNADGGGDQDGDSRNPALFGLTSPIAGSDNVFTSGSGVNRKPSIKKAANYSLSPARDDSPATSSSEGEDEADAAPLPEHIISHPLFSHHARSPPSLSRRTSIRSTGQQSDQYDGGDSESRGRSRQSRIHSQTIGPSAVPIPRSRESRYSMSSISAVVAPEDPVLSTSQPEPVSPASAFLSSYSAGDGSFTSSPGGGNDLAVNLSASIPSLILSPAVTSMNMPLDAAGAKVLGYTLGKIIGRGGFSTVRVATKDSTGETFACRIVKRDDLSDQSGSLKNFEAELQLWKDLSPHPRLLPLIELYRTPDESVTFLFSPHMARGSLLDVLNQEKGGEKTARKYFPGVVEAVRALHEGYPGFELGGMLHGDVKLDNVLVGENGEVCLCDFGLAQKLKHPDGSWVHAPEIPRLESPRQSRSRSRSRQRKSATAMPVQHRLDPLHLPHNRLGKSFPSASLPYAPPELLTAPPSPPSLAQDIWALGVILYALLTSRLPFVDAFDPRLQMKILRGEWKMPDNVGPEWAECLAGCLEGAKEKRWSIRRLAESDAVTGWRGVKTRSRSRSRTRRDHSREPRQAMHHPLPHSHSHHHHHHHFGFESDLELVPESGPAPPSRDRSREKLLGSPPNATFRPSPLTSGQRDRSRSRGRNNEAKAINTNEA